MDYDEAKLLFLARECAQAAWEVASSEDKEKLPRTYKPLRGDWEALHELFSQVTPDQETAFENAVTEELWRLLRAKWEKEADLECRTYFWKKVQKARKAF